MYRKVQNKIITNKKGTVRKHSFLQSLFEVFRGWKKRCRISELNRSKLACKGDPKACEGTSRGEVRLELIGKNTKKPANFAGFYIIFLFCCSFTLWIVSNQAYKRSALFLHSLFYDI